MMDRLRFRSLRRSPDDPAPVPVAQTPLPAPAQSRSPPPTSPLSKDPITVEQVEALQCADALQEIYLLAARTIPPTSPLHLRAEKARALILTHAGLSPGCYPELVRPWTGLPDPEAPAVQPEKKKEKRAYFLG